MIFEFLQVFPNPLYDGLLNLKFSPSWIKEISIYNAQGILKEKLKINKFTEHLELDLVEYQSGPACWRPTAFDCVYRADVLRTLP